MERTTREKKLDLAGREVTVRELTIGHLWRLVEKTDDDTNFYGEFATLLKDATGLEPVNLEAFTFSEFESLLNNVLEVNSALISVARIVGLDGIGDVIKAKIKETVKASVAAGFENN